MMYVLLIVLASVIVFFIGILAFKWLVLNNRLTGTAGGSYPEEETENIFVKKMINDEVSIDLIGKEGKSITVLHPAGKVLVGGIVYSVEADNQYIEIDENIQITQINGNRIKVIKKQ